MFEFVSQFLKLILILFSPVLAFFGAILVLIAYHFLKARIVAKKRLKKRVSNYVERSFSKKIFIDFPKQLVEDLYNRDPNDFTGYGLWLYCGFQGTGKTLSVVYDLMRYQKMFPKLKVRTNMEYKYQDGEITCGDDLLNNNNGTYGQIEVIDEIQSWYSSLQSKDFPPHLLEEICQQRKQRKMIMGTCQVYSRVAKPLREVCAYVVCPKTYFGCITVCRVTKPQYWNEEKQEFTKFLRSYFFVHNSEIRNAYDTYKKIEKMRQVGFRDITPMDQQDMNLNLGVSFKK